MDATPFLHGYKDTCRPSTAPGFQDAVGVVQDFEFETHGVVITKRLKVHHQAGAPFLKVHPPSRFHPARPMQFDLVGFGLACRQVAVYS